LAAIASPGASVYSMTKAAVAALTRGLARDLRSRGITVNTVKPGPTETECGRAHPRHAATDAGAGAVSAETAKLPA
jgi:3-oxoacyl-[acyl-carrier protein] reductase